MRIRRTENALRGAFWGTILKIYQIIMPFIIRTVIIYYLGIEYVGLNSLFTSLLSVLNLAELGVGSAMVFSMYKPIANDDSERLGRLISLYRVYYRIIGIAILLFGLTIMPFTSRLIKGDVPNGLNIYILYIMNLSATVMSYWLFAYRNSLLYAYQRNDVINIISIVTSTISYIFQFIVLFVFHDYYLFLCVILLTQILTNIITAQITFKLYPSIEPFGFPEKSEIHEINHRILDVFTSKIAGTVISSSDTIVLSAFLGVTVLGIYQNYFYVMTAVIAIIDIIINSCLAGIGNSLITESNRKNYYDFQKLTFLIVILATVGSACFLNMYTPFIILWVGTDYLLAFSMVILFSIYFYLYTIQQVGAAYKDAAGIWRIDKYRPLVTAVLNVILNIISVQIIGVHGILLSTIVSYVFVAIPWLTVNLFKNVFRLGMRYYVVEMLKYLVESLVAIGASYMICEFLDTWVFSTFLRLVVHFVVCIVISGGLFILCNRKKVVYRDTKRLIIQLLGKVFKVCM